MHLLLHRVNKTRGLADNGTGNTVVPGGWGRGGGGGEEGGGGRGMGGGAGLRIVCSQQQTRGDAEARHAGVRASWHGSVGVYQNLCIIHDSCLVSECMFHIRFNNM